jgi:hypothetical protein
MNVIVQLSKEFWFPLIVAVGWVLFNIYGGNAGQNKPWGFKEVVNIFGPSFFLASWITGQFFRVKKQVKVESSLSVMEDRLRELLTTLEQKTADLISHVSGGASFPWIQFGMLDDNTGKGTLMVVHQGEHPLYDVAARIVDLNKFELIKNHLTADNFRQADTTIEVGNIIPGHASMVGAWKIEGLDRQNYNVFFTARNGRFTQLIRMMKIDGKWISATKVSNGSEEIVHEQVSESFPRDAEGRVIWDKA